MSIVYCANIKDITWSQIERYLNIISEKETKQIFSLKQGKDRCLTLAGKILLLYALKQHGIWFKNKLPELSYNLFGKPFLKGSFIDFNISHSGDFVVCSYISNGLIGIDIEKIQPLNILEFTKVFTRDELDSFKEDINYNCLKLWTIKEAIMKASGLGFSMNPFDIKIINNESHTKNQRWFIFPLEINPDYLASLASSIYEIPIIERVSINSLTKFIC